MNNFQRKYDSLFHFYFAKDINKLIGKNKSNHDSIILKDYAYFDQEAQFLKRYYQNDQFSQRILMFANYFESQKQFPFNCPNLMKTSGKKHLQKRKKRHRKLKIKLEQLKSQQSVQFDSDFLQSIKSDELQQEQYQQRYGFANKSYDSLCYDIYDPQQVQNEQQQNNLNQLPLKLLQMTNARSIKIQNLQEQDISHLILDFKDVDIDKILCEFKNLQENKKYQIKQQKKINGKKKQYLNSGKQYSIDKYLNNKRERLNTQNQINKNSNRNNLLKKIKNNDIQNQNHGEFQEKYHKLKNQNIIQNYDRNNPVKNNVLSKNPYFLKLHQLDQQHILLTTRSPKFETQRIERAKSGFMSDRIAPDIQKQLRYINLIKKLKQNKQMVKDIEMNKRTRSPQQIQLLQFKDIQKYKKMQKIKQKAVQLINGGYKKGKLFSKDKNLKSPQNYHFRYN